MRAARQGLDHPSLRRAILQFTALSGLRYVDTPVPVSVRNVLDQVAIEVLGAVRPPDRTTLPQRHFCRVHGATGCRQQLPVLRAQRCLDLTAGVHEVSYQLGFTPVFTDTYKKADRGRQECSCRSE